MCAALDISQRTYYKYRDCEDKDYYDYLLIKEIFDESNGIQISMSRKGTPIDDSPMESFHGILKKETLYNNDITNLTEYIALVEDWLEFYNTKRLKNKRR